MGDPLKESELNLFFRLVDKNGDGRLQYDEFLGFLRGEREVEEVSVPDGNRDRDEDDEDDDDEDG